MNDFEKLQNDLKEHGIFLREMTGRKDTFILSKISTGKISVAGSLGPVMRFGRLLV